MRFLVVGWFSATAGEHYTAKCTGGKRIAMGIHGPGLPMARLSVTLVFP
jgi:hypothetical protein